MEQFQRLGDFEGAGRLAGAKGKWHWAVAFRHPEFGIVIFDPHQSAPSFLNMPFDVICIDFSIYEPKGEWIQVEQRVALVRQ